MKLLFSNGYMIKFIENIINIYFIMYYKHRFKIMDALFVVYLMFINLVN